MAHLKFAMAHFNHVATGWETLVYTVLLLSVRFLTLNTNIFYSYLRYRYMN